MASSPRPRPEDLCARTWLIIHGSGLASENLASDIAQQCQRLRIHTRVRTIDDYASDELVRFPSLVVCLPTLSSTTNIRQALEPFATLVSDYRTRWLPGLARLREGSVEAIDVGVVQLYGETVALHNPMMRSAYTKACYVQAIDADPGVDALRPYASALDPVRATPWSEPGDVADDVISQTWRFIQEWGVTTMRTVPTLLACIEKCRKVYEDPRKPSLYRPVPEHPLNRLDFILDRPDVTPGEAGKTWQENGARVCRQVREKLALVVPGLKRPGDPRAPGAQDDLRRLYEGLKIIDTHLRSL